MNPTLSHYLITQAYNNAWSNHRLLKACALLTDEQFRATDRVSFFPSIKATLNHILTCDWFYIDALERDARGEPPHPDYESFFALEEPFDTCASLSEAQRAADRRLIAFCTQQSEADLGRTVTILRGDRFQRDTRTRLLAHLFQHQVHHRGQVHAMLSGTQVEPPQLDEFFSAGEREDRAQDFAELGWTEEGIWNGPLK